MSKKLTKRELAEVRMSVDAYSPEGQNFKCAFKTFAEAEAVWKEQSDDWLDVSKRQREEYLQCVMQFLLEYHEVYDYINEMWALHEPTGDVGLAIEEEILRLYREEFVKLFPEFSAKPKKRKPEKKVVKPYDPFDL